MAPTGTILLIILGVAVLLAVTDCIAYIATGRRHLSRTVLVFTEIISIIAAPLFFLWVSDLGMENDCCTESAFFSPAHRFTVYFIILVCVITYYYSAYRKSLASPLLELVVNCLLLIGIVLNIFIAIQTTELIVWVLGNTSIIALFLSQLYKNHQLITEEVTTWDNQKTNVFERTALKIVKAKFIIRYPLLLILCLPILLLISVLLLVFGQKPDSVIRAFTDTYKHGLSQLDYLCDNVECGGHYLCSVAANGHTGVVRPERYGERNGNRIICNRQLLVDNSFEELIEQRFPAVHSFIRKKYNRVGDMVHRYYNVFSNKFFSDIIYFLMKPVEYFFLFCLYLFDKKPENRIAVQYLNRTDRERIKAGE